MANGTVPSFFDKGLHRTVIQYNLNLNYYSPEAKLY